MSARAGRMLGVLLAAVLATLTAQQMLSPVFAPLSREIDLSEIQLGLVMTVGAAVFAVFSPYWGRACDRIGYRAVLVRGLVLSAVGLIGFAVISALAYSDELPSGVTFTVMLATRSLFFGLGVAAVPVAALAYVGATSPGVQARTKAVSMVGAFQGLALVLGPALGGGLAAIELLLPIYLAPAVIVVLIFVALLTLPRLTAKPDRGATSTARLRLTDARLLPYLMVAFLVMLSLGLVQVILGFVYQDRLGTDAEATAAAVGAAGFLVGLVLIGTQAVAVPRLGWQPRRLLAVGTPIAALGLAGFALADQFWTMSGCLMGLALGLGLAMPGYTAGASLSVGEHEQGGVAGLLSATTGATFVIGPLIGTILYRAEPASPMILAAGLCLLSFLVVVLHPAIRPARQVSDAEVEEGLEATARFGPPG